MKPDISRRGYVRRSGFQNGSFTDGAHQRRAGAVAASYEEGLSEPKPEVQDRSPKVEQGGPVDAPSIQLQ